MDGYFEWGGHAAAVKQISEYEFILFVENALYSNPVFCDVSKIAYICGMTQRFAKYKGIHPGAVIERELKKRNLTQRSLALSVGEHPQTFNAILKGERKLNTPLGLKIERALQLDEGDLLMLQLFYEIELQKRKEATANHPELAVLRKSLFWDTDINGIDWHKQAKAVITRVFERGNTAEKREMIRFYGSDKVGKVINNINKDKSIRR